jgi:hypothetical protein
MLIGHISLVTSGLVGRGKIEKTVEVSNLRGKNKIKIKKC